MIVLSNDETTVPVYGIYDKVVGVPASSLSQLRGPWPENLKTPALQYTMNNRLKYEVRQSEVRGNFVPEALHI